MASQSKNSNNKRRLGVEQRRALEKVLRERYAGLVQEEQEKDSSWQSEIRKRILTDVKQELGVDKIEKKIQALVEKKSDFGFSRFNDIPDLGSSAHKLFDERMSEIRKEQKDLKTELEEKISRIWTVESVEEAEEIMGLSGRN